MTCHKKTIREETNQSAPQVVIEEVREEEVCGTLNTKRTVSQGDRSKLHGSEANFAPRVTGKPLYVGRHW